MSSNYYYCYLTVNQKDYFSFLCLKKFFQKDYSDASRMAHGAWRGEIAALHKVNQGCHPLGRWLRPAG
jgi:hypothetical protein